jgi:hypothetical protein
MNFFDKTLFAIPAPLDVKSYLDFKELYLDLEEVLHFQNFIFCKAGGVVQWFLKY